VTGAEVFLAAPLAVALGVAGGFLIGWLLHRFGWVVSVPVACVLAVIMYVGFIRAEDYEPMLVAAVACGFALRWMLPERSSRSA
jgi:MFS-type transporter involved in bile tolerance (Atg22 family)